MASGREPPDTAMAGDLTRRIRSSAKYRSLDEALVHRIATDAARRFSGRDDAARYARRKLHQAFGAFLAGSPVRAVAGAVATVSSGQADLRSAALSAMRAHASSAERIAWLGPFYAQVARWCGAPASVADMACGLNPLAIPWMALAPGASYWACGIDAELVAALPGLAQIMPVTLTAATWDLAAAPPAALPAVRADVTLLLKTVTTIEQQAPGSAGRVLGALDCGHVILSLPRRSLSGRRGYTDQPAAIAARAAAGSRYRIRGEAAFGSELVYHLTPEPPR